MLINRKKVVFSLCFLMVMSFCVIIILALLSHRKYQIKDKKFDRDYIELLQLEKVKSIA